MPAQTCIDRIGARSTCSIDVLLNTHHHRDHTGGNQTFRPVVGSIVAHENSADWQRRVAVEASIEAQQAYPDRTFTDEWRATVGDETVVARYHGAGHTSGDIVVTLEQANVVHMGDLVFNRFHPIVDRPSGARIANWTTTLERVAAAHAAETIYVFGHANPSHGPTGTRAESLPGFADFMGPIPSITVGPVLGAAYDELAG